jgi:hypothetical protein
MNEEVGGWLHNASACHCVIATRILEGIANETTCNRPSVLRYVQNHRKWTTPLSTNASIDNAFMKRIGIPSERSLSLISFVCTLS